MKMLSAQQIFNKVAKGLIKQGVRTTKDSFGDYPVIDESGNRCALGMLVDSNRPNNGNRRFKLSGVDEDANDRLLMELQFAHDNNKPSRWPRVLRRIAREHKLKIPTWLECTGMTHDA